MVYGVYGLWGLHNNQYDFLFPHYTCTVPFPKIDRLIDARLARLIEVVTFRSHGVVCRFFGYPRLIREPKGALGRIGDYWVIYPS